MTASPILLFFALAPRPAAAAPSFGDFYISKCRGAAPVISNYSPTVYTTVPDTWSVTVAAPSGLMGDTEPPTVISGTQGLWHMDEPTGTTAADATVAGNTLSDASLPNYQTSTDCNDAVTAVSTATVRTPGKFGNALTYPSVCHSNRYSYARSTIPVLGNVFLGSFSVEAWIRNPVTPVNGTLRTSVGEMPLLINCNNRSALQCMFLGVRTVGGAQKLSMDFGAYLAASTGTTTITPNVWHHVAYTYDASLGAQTVYLDGNADGSTYLVPSLTAVNTSTTMVGGGAFHLAVENGCHRESGRRRLLRRRHRRAPRRQLRADRGAGRRSLGGSGAIQPVGHFHPSADDERQRLF